MSLSNVIGANQINEDKLLAKYPAYFAEKYVFSKQVRQSRRNDKRRFHIFDYQIDLINEYKENTCTYVPKARQMGITLANAAYAMWHMVYNEDTRIKVCSPKLNMSEKYIDYIKQCIFRVKNINVSHVNRSHIRLSNGSELSVINRDMLLNNLNKAMHGFSNNVLILDEITDISKIVNFVDTSFPSVEKLIVTFTPRGDTCLNIDLDKYGSVVSIPYSEHPKRDISWIKDKESIMGKEQTKWEYNLGNSYN